MNMLEINNLCASVEGKEILKGINLSIGYGEVHVIMGPNGSGKSTLSNVLVGNPKYEVTQGSVSFAVRTCSAFRPMPVRTRVFSCRSRRRLKFPECR